PCSREKSTSSAGGGAAPGGLEPTRAKIPPPAHGEGQGQLPRRGAPTRGGRARGKNKPSAGGGGGGAAGPAARRGVRDRAAPLQAPRSGVAAALYKGMILVLGGELPPNHTFPENESYEAASGRWVALAPMPAGRHGFGGAVIGSNAYFVGGSLTPGGGGITD